MWDSRFWPQKKGLRHSSPCLFLEQGEDGLIEHTSLAKCFMELKGWYSLCCVHCYWIVCILQERGFPTAMDSIFLVSLLLNHMSQPIGSAKPTFSALSLRENEKGKCVFSPFIHNQKHTTQVTLSEHVPFPPSMYLPFPTTCPRQHIPIRTGLAPDTAVLSLSQLWESPNRKPQNLND